MGGGGEVKKLMAFLVVISLAFPQIALAGPVVKMFQTLG